MTIQQSVPYEPKRPSQLELVLRLHGEYRRCLEPIGVTPLQAGVLLHVHRHTDTYITNIAAALCLRPPTLTKVVNDLVRKRWLIRRRSVTDTRVVHLRLSRRGEALTRHIDHRVHHVTIALTEEIRKALDRILPNRADLRLLTF